MVLLNLMEQRLKKQLLNKLVDLSIKKHGNSKFISMLFYV